jgi:hypothetical protein
MSINYFHQESNSNSLKQFLLDENIYAFTVKGSLILLQKKIINYTNRSNNNFRAYNIIRYSLHVYNLYHKSSVNLA